MVTAEVYNVELMNECEREREREKPHPFRHIFKWVACTNCILLPVVATIHLRVHHS